MDPRRAFLFTGLVILAWMIFWNTAIRVSAVRRHSKTGDSPALEGLIVAV